MNDDAFPVFSAPSSPRGMILPRVVGGMARWCGLGWLCAGAMLSAQTPDAATDPVGYTTIALSENSDTMVAVPFQRAAEYTGHVAALQDATLTVSGTPNWAVNRFVYAAGTQSNTYYVFFRTGARAGHVFPVTASGANTLTLSPGAGSLAGVVAGDSIKVVPHWTLGTLFPASSAGLAFTATTNPAAPETTLFFTAPGAAGINPAPTATYLFHSGAWRQADGNLAESKDDTIVPPGVPFRVRNRAAGGVLVVVGSVVVERQAVVLGTSTSSAQDHAVSLLRPVPVSLNDAGLAASGAFSASPNALARTDLLLVFDNTVAQQNKPAAEYFIFHNSAWRKLGQPLTEDYGGEPVFGPTKSVVIRKGATADGAAATWVNTPKY